MRPSEQGRRNLEQWQSNDSNWVLNDDRVRKALARSFRTNTGTTEAQGNQFDTNVREYQAGQSERQGSIRALISGYQRSRSEQKLQLQQVSQACEQFERSVRGLQNTKHELNQAITSVRNASDQVKEINEPRQSYSPSRGMRY